MRYFRHTDLDDTLDVRLKAYDHFIQQFVPAGFKWPVRMRDWELDMVLTRLDKYHAGQRVLDTGSHNTYLGIWLSMRFDEVHVSDLLGHRKWKNWLRRLHILPRKVSEAPFGVWASTCVHASAKIHLKSVDLTCMPYPDNSLDVITSISVIEHIPQVELALSEMVRCLKPGGRILLTTDSAEVPRPYSEGVRYFSPEELERLFKPYRCVGPVNDPDFSRDNWGYGKTKAAVPCFVEITK